jgi:hypothetical protein
MEVFMRVAIVAAAAACVAAAVAGGAQTPPHGTAAGSISVLRAAGSAGGAAGDPVAQEGQQGAATPFPLSTIGRLFFNTNGDAPGVSHNCIAALIDKSVILTAAHCVQDVAPPFRYYRNFMFALYGRGIPRRAYRWRCLVTPTAWAQDTPARFAHDAAMIALEGESDVGWLGLEWNRPPQNGAVSLVGYSTDGEVEAQPGMLSAGADGVVEFTYDKPRRLEIGGPWVINYSPQTAGGPDVAADANRIIGWTVFSVAAKPDSVFSPYFGREVGTLLKSAKNDCKA